MKAFEDTSKFILVRQDATGTWVTIQDHGVRWMLFDTPKDAEMFGKNVFGYTKDSCCGIPIVALTKCYMNAWYHTGEEEYEMFLKTGKKKWDTDWLVYEGESFEDTEWFISRSKYHKRAFIAPAGFYRVGEHHCYIMVNELRLSSDITSID
jgi:hypothetical protein